MLILHSSNTTKESEFVLRGTVKIEDFEFTAAVFFAKDHITSNTLWAIYGLIKPNITIGELVPIVEGTPVNFVINELAVVYASAGVSRTTSFPQSFNPHHYPLVSSGNFLFSLFVFYY